MVMGNCMPGEDAAAATTTTIGEAVQALGEALAKIGKGSEDKPEPGIVSIRKEVTAYDFNIEAVTKAFTDAISTIFFRPSSSSDLESIRARTDAIRAQAAAKNAREKVDGSRRTPLEQSELAEYLSRSDDKEFERFMGAAKEAIANRTTGMADYVGDRAVGSEMPETFEEADALLAAAKERVARGSVSRVSPLETPDGKLQSEFASLIATSLLGEEPDEQSVRQALEVVNVVVSEQHRAQLLEELARASGMRLGSAGGAVVSDWVKKNQAGEAAAAAEEGTPVA